MNVMFPVNSFFVRLQDDNSRVKLTVWTDKGDKIVSEYVSAASLDNLWSFIEKSSSAEVVSEVKARLGITVA